MSHHDVLPLGERLEVEAALETAFAPLRDRHTYLSALRVRAAVRWGRGGREARGIEPAPAALRAPAAMKAPAAIKWSGALARLSELSLAAGMSVMIFTAAFGPGPAPERAASTVAAEQAAEREAYPVPRVTAALDDEGYIRWLRIDRYVPLQDWLDPSTVRPGLTKRPDPPPPRSGAPLSRDPY